MGLAKGGFWCLWARWASFSLCWALGSRTELLLSGFGGEGQAGIPAPGSAFKTPQGVDVLYNGAMPTELILGTELGQLEVLREYLEDAGVRQGLPAQTVFQLNLALEELVTNTMIHGFQGDRGHEIRLVFQFDPGTVTVTVIDDGIPFNPLAQPSVDSSLPLEEREPGGLGIHLVRQVVDEIDYGFEDGWNKVVITKHFSTGAA